jgi:hypothetical protein
MLPDVYSNSSLEDKAPSSLSIVRQTILKKVLQLASQSCALDADFNTFKLR